MSYAALPRWVSYACRFCGNIEQYMPVYEGGINQRVCPKCGRLFEPLVNTAIVDPEQPLKDRLILI